MKRITILFLASALLAIACRSTSLDGLRPDPGAARPSLEQIFLEPPISGHAPRIDSISVDGRFVLFTWAPPEAHADDRRAPLRLLDASDPKQSGQRGIPLEELVPPSDPKRADRERIHTVRWSPVGSTLAVARGRALWLLDAPTRRAVLAVTAPPIVEVEADAGDEGSRDAEDSNTGGAGGAEDADAAVAEADEDERPLGTIRSLRFSRDGTELRFSDRQELYSIRVPARGLPDAPLELDDARWWSEELDGRALSLRWSQDLDVVFGVDPAPFAAPEKSGKPEKKGTEKTGEPDANGEDTRAGAQVWLLREERAVVLEGAAELEDLENTSLSPDGRFVIGFHVDRSGDPEPTLMPNYLTERVTTVETRRKLADDGPSPLRGFVWRTGTGERSSLGILSPAGGDGASPGDFASFWPRSIGWAPMHEAGRPARFAFERLSEDFRELEIFTWTEGELKRIWHERDERWIGGPARYARWSQDGRLLLVGSESHADSTTPGRCQLFAVNPENGRVHQLTEVGGELARFHVTPAGDLLIQASFEDPARRSLARLELGRLADPATAREHWQRIESPAGWCSDLRWSGDGGAVVFRHETLLEPGELWWSDGREARQLTRTVPSAFEEVDWIRPERLELESEDGRRVRAHVWLPEGTRIEDNPGPRATVVFVHGAGYLQNVTESMTRYPLNAMFHSRLARMGYPVIDVDYRGSAGYGRDFRTDVQYHLGGKDLDDIHLVLDHLIDEGLVDGERVGIYGGSYGGFMALMALFTAPDRWAAGAALRSVTDWRTYHPVYTQPRLGRPSTHAEAYERSSPIDHAEKLEDPLLILHGMMDSNVFAQDSVRLIEKLIDHQLDFDAMLYPSQGHAFADGPHWLDEYRRIERHMLEHLGPPRLH